MTHDLAVVAQVADHIVVLYSGEIMEQGSVDQIINNPDPCLYQTADGCRAADRPRREWAWS